MNIVIVESPAKAKTIEKYLGKDFKVLASFGHIRDLPSKDGSVDPDNNFAMNYVVPKDSERHIKPIVDAVKKADAIYLATDLDREGEAISWHVLEELKRRVKDMDTKHVHRIEFSEITKKAINEAVANPRTLAMDLVNAQQARRALDYLVGFNLSPVLWRKVRGGLSAGRVQSVALRLICERENEIEAFVPQEYWSIEGVFATPEAKTLTARLALIDGEKVEKFSFGNQAAAEAAVARLENNTYSITDIAKKQVRRFPAAPFITSTLQMEASRKLGFSARRTMNAAQRLYEAGHITYMRTDSVNLAAEAVGALRSQIETQYGKSYIPAKPNTFKTKTQNAQEAHEAIRPTDFSHGATGPGGLEDDQARLYKLIWQRTVASQMAPAVMDQTSLTIATADKRDAFRATGSVITFDGFLKVYHEGRDDTAEDDTAENILPQVNDRDPMDLRELKHEQHFTEPPPRYSEASLVKALEENGIGRPSTYASIISTIQDRGYVRQEKRRFIPEDVGRVVSRFLVEHFPKYVDLGFTAEMESELDEVSRGERDWIPMLRDFWQPFKSLVDDKITSVKKSDVTSEKTGEACPTCKEGELVIRLGKYGKFKGCSRYPECRHIENLDGSAPAARAEPKDTGVQCPKCKTNNIVERTSRRGKVFYGCSGYPKCKYAVWDPPQEKPCPECDWPITTVKETKRQGTVIKCPECAWQDPPAPAKSATAKTANKKPAAKKPATKKPTAKKSTARKTAAKNKKAS